MKKVEAEPYRDIDFSVRKRGPVIEPEPGKTKISIRLDNRAIEHFRTLVEQAGGGNYPFVRQDQENVPAGTARTARQITFSSSKV